MMLSIDPGLLNQTLVQSANELSEGWQANNYSLLRISRDEFAFYDFDEQLVQAFAYEIEEDGKIIFQPDQSTFGFIKQQNESRLTILSQDGIIHFIRIPDAEIKLGGGHINEAFEDSHWVTNQMGNLIKFTYADHNFFDQRDIGSGAPTTQVNDQMEMLFTIKRPFGKSFLLMYADDILVDAFPIHMILEDAIEFYSSLTPLTIKVLNRI